MEIMFQWFWLVKFFLTLLTLGAAYKASKNKGKSILWNIVAGVFLLLAIISPIKLNIDTRSQTNRANALIEERKKLSPKIIDNSFEVNTQFEGITSKDIDLTK